MQIDTRALASTLEAHTQSSEVDNLPNAACLEFPKTNIPKKLQEDSSRTHQQKCHLFQEALNSHKHLVPNELSYLSKPSGFISSGPS